MRRCLLGNLFSIFLILFSCSVLALEKNSLLLEFAPSKDGTTVFLHAADQPDLVDDVSRLLKRFAESKIKITIAGETVCVHGKLLEREPGKQSLSLLRTSGGVSMEDLAETCSRGWYINTLFMTPRGLLLGRRCVEVVHKVLAQELGESCRELAVDYQLQQGYIDDSETESLKVAFCLVPVAKTGKELAAGTVVPFKPSTSIDEKSSAALLEALKSGAKFSMDKANFLTQVCDRLAQSNNDVGVLLILSRINACLEHAYSLLPAQDEIDAGGSLVKSEPNPVIDSLGRLQSSYQADWSSIQVDSKKFLQFCKLLEQGLLGDDGVREMDELGDKISSQMNKSMGIDENQKRILKLALKQGVNHTSSEDSTDGDTRVADELAGQEQQIEAIRRMFYMLAHDCCYFLCDDS